jgi:hypothetical protein
MIFAKKAVKKDCGLNPQNHLCRLSLWGSDETVDKIKEK